MNLARIALTCLALTFAHHSFSLGSLGATLSTTPGGSNGSYTVTASWNGLSQSPRYVLSERLDSGAWRAVGSDLSSKAFSDQVSGVYDYRLVEMMMISAGSVSFPVYLAESSYTSLNVDLDAPQDLQAVGTWGSGESTLSWSAVDDENVAQYVIQEQREGESGFSGEAQKTVTDTTHPTSHALADLPAGVHKYRVIARRLVGGSDLDSDWSEELSVVVPQAPTLVMSTSNVTDAHNLVTFSPSNSLVTHYWLEKRASGGDWISLGSTPNVTETVFQDINGTYQYRAYACTAQACGAYSNASNNVLVNIPDGDGDGVNDVQDVFPNDASEWEDSDGDGVGNNSDAFPNDETETVDTDGDGIGDNGDTYPTRIDPGVDTVNQAVDPANDSLSGAEYLGAVTGEHSVGQDGSFNYRIPIEVPPGINGIQPDLALTYNSNRKNGLVGMGWAIGGLSTISRCNATLLRDGFVAGINPSDLSRYADGRYRYCIDGQRLVHISGGTYRTEQEKFVRIGFENDVWTVTYTDGKQLRYGYNNDSRRADSEGDTYAWYLDQSQDISGNTMTVSYDTAEAGVLRPEEIKYTQNAAGGTQHKVTFNYSTQDREDVLTRYRSGALELMDKRLANIIVSTNNSRVRKYSLMYQLPGVINNGVAYSDPIGQSRLEEVRLCYADSAHCAEPIKFDWSDVEPGVFEDERISLTDHGPMSSEQVGKRAYSYYLQIVSGYFNSDLQRDGFYPYTVYTGTDFEIGAIAVSSSAFENVEEQICTDRRLSGVDQTLCESIPSHGTRIALDLNSDGLDDLMVVPAISGIDVHLKAFINAGDGEFEYHPGYSLLDTPGRELSFFIRYNSGSNNENEQVVPYRFYFRDINGDGLADVLRLPIVLPTVITLFSAFPDDISVALNTGNGFADFNQWMDIDDLPDLLSEVATEDVNGDGLVDIIAASGAVAINRGSSFQAASQWRMFSATMGRYSSGLPENSNRYNGKVAPTIFDINGDGMGDYVYISTYGDPAVGDDERTTGENCNLPGCRKIFIETAISNGEDFAALQSTQFTYSEESMGSFRTAYDRVTSTFKDMNQDGLLDIVWFVESGSSSPLGPSHSGLPNKSFAVSFSRGDGHFTNPEPITADHPTYVVVNAHQPRITSVDSAADVRLTYQPFNLRDPEGDYIPENEKVTIYTQSENISSETNRLLSMKSVPHMTSGFVGEPGIRSTAVIDRAGSRRMGVHTLSVDTPSGTAVEDTYHYYDAKYHRGGFGSLGFAKIEKTSEVQATGGPVKYLRTTSEYSQEFVDAAPEKYSLAGRLTKRTVEHLNSPADTNPKRISEYRANWQVRDYNRTVEPYYLAYKVSETEHKYALENSGVPVSVTIQQLYAAEGLKSSCQIPEAVTFADRVIDTDEHIHTSSGLPFTKVDANCDVYGTRGSEEINGDIVSKDNGRVRGLVRQNTTTYWDSRTTGNKVATFDNEYNYSGQLSQTVRQAGGSDDETLTTAYTYNDYGSVETVTESWAGSSNGMSANSRTKRIDEEYYSSAQKLTYTDELGHVSIVVNDPRFGLETKFTDINQLETHTQYDQVGRPVLVSHADGTTTQLDYRYCFFCGFETYNSSVKWYTQLKSTGKSAERSYYDDLGRELGGRTIGLTGTPTYQFKWLDRFGRIVVSSQPNRGGERNLTAYYYDTVGRLVSTKRPDQSEENRVYSAVNWIGFAIDKTEIVDSLTHSTVQVVDANGQVRKVTDALTNTIEYDYDGYGNLVTATTTDDQSTAISQSILYDSLGRKKTLIDPDIGTVNFSYNPLGLVYEETDAMSQRTLYQYDKLGRQTRRTDIGVSTQVHDWVYYSTPGAALGLVESVNGVDTEGRAYSESYSYDALSRLRETRHVIGGGTYVTQQHYDAFGRPGAYTYPSGLVSRNLYNEHGYLVALENPLTDDKYWHATGDDAFGNITGFIQGNGVSTVRGYDEKTGRIGDILAGAGAVQDHDYQFDTEGNLESRTDNLFNRSESFVYDDLNRLTSVTGDYGAGQTIDYYSNGNIKRRTDVSGNALYEYGDGAGPHAVTSIGGSSYTYNAKGEMTTGGGRTEIKYTVYGKPTFAEKGAYSTLIAYGSNKTRVQRVDDGPSGTETTTYVEGVYERVVKAGETTTERHYIGDTAIVDSLDQVVYLHHDHIGSLVAKTDESGNLIETIGNEPWGQQVDQWGGVVKPQDYDPDETDIGFTGHEHMTGVGLIHMNGRVYDPLIGRFLSPDPYIPAPTNTQSFDRYSYVMNNPLSLNDPSGFTPCDSHGGQSYPGRVSCIGNFGGSSSGQQTGTSRIEVNYDNYGIPIEPDDFQGDFDEYRGSLFSVESISQTGYIKSGGGTLISPQFTTHYVGGNVFSGWSVQSTANVGFSAQKGQDHGSGGQEGGVNFNFDQFANEIRDRRFDTTAVLGTLATTLGVGTMPKTPAELRGLGVPKNKLNPYTGQLSRWSGRTGNRALRELGRTAGGVALGTAATGLLIFEGFYNWGVIGRAAVNATTFQSDDGD
ncbi:tRNA3(Ser)-specific nuclease WapA [Halioglobus japonicus]|nr:tRNA3(Ser)-specific nuclease WapA [Halioglobus japonicus]